MAKQGTFTALQQLKPISTDFSDIMKEGQNFDNTQRKLRIQEQDAEIRKAKADRDSENAFNKKYGIDDSAILKTGFNNYDELMLPYADSVKNEMWKTKEALRKNPRDMKLQQKFSNLSNSVKTIKASNDSFSSLLQKYAKLQDEGGISGVHEDKWLDLLQKYKEYKVIPTIDRDTGMTSMVYEDDKGEKVVINLQDMIDGNIDIYAKQNANKLAGQIADGLGVRTKDNVTGRFINTEISFDSVKEPARIAVQSYLQTDEQLADILNQANGSTRDKWDVSTDEGKAQRDKDVQTATDWLVEQVKGSYDTKDTLKERFQPRKASTSTAGERKTRQQVIDRNQTIANVQQGDVEQLIGRPAFSVNDKGVRVNTIIEDAVVTDNELVLSLADGSEQRVSLLRKSALNEIYNVATGIRVDSDMLDKIQDVSATKSGDIFEEAQVKLTDSELDFVNEIAISKEESDALSDLREGVESLGFKIREAVIGKNVVKVSNEAGTVSIEIKTGLTGEQAKKEVNKLKEFLRENSGTKKGLVKKGTNKIELSDKASAL